MTNKLIDELIEVEQELKQLQEQHKNKIKDFQQEIEAAKVDANQAQQKVASARNGNDPEAYAKAVADQRTANDIVGYYSGKLEKLETEPLVTEEEYKAYTKRIKSKMDNINIQARTRASELLHELEDIQNELSPAYIKTNNLLRNLQNNLFKNSAEKQMELAKKTGNLVMSELNNEYRDNSISEGIRYILNSHATKNIKEMGNN